MNYFGTNYQNSYQPMMNQLPVQQPQIQQPTVTTPTYNNGGQFFFVNSKDEAEKWIVNQGQTVYLFDVNKGIFYEKSVGRNGLPQPIQTYQYKKEEIVEPEKKDEPKVEYVTKEEFLEMQTKLKSEIKKLKPINRTKKETTNG